MRDRLDRMRITRRPFDADDYEHRVRSSPCFVCGIVRGSTIRDDCYNALGPTRNPERPS